MVKGIGVPFLSTPGMGGVHLRRELRTGHSGKQVLAASE